MTPVLTSSHVSVLTQWLHIESTSPESNNANARYHHLTLKEDETYRQQAIYALKLYVREAHQDAINSLRVPAGISLDPLGATPTYDPAVGYPRLLNIRTLKGYLGEILAGLVAEYFSPFGQNGWRVPVFLFRFHTVAFQQLERINQTNENAGFIPGRTGDDCLAFKLDTQGEVEYSLVCEAKCLNAHNNGKLAEAHEKVSDGALIPVDVLRIIAILDERVGDADAQQWVKALRHLLLRQTVSNYERCDMVCYVCPAPVHRSSWLSSTSAHTSYTAHRRLQAVEVYFDDIENLVNEVYRTP